MRINVSEKIDQFVFADICKLSAKMKKKKKRSKKKVGKRFEELKTTDGSNIRIFRENKNDMLSIY